MLDVRNLIMAIDVETVKQRCNPVLSDYPRIYAIAYVREHVNHFYGYNERLRGHEYNDAEVLRTVKCYAALTAQDEVDVLVAFADAYMSENDYEKFTVQQQFEALKLFETK